jgi:nicotinamidase-related amidase
MTAPRRALVVIDVQNEYFTGNLPIEYPAVDITLPNIGRAMDVAAAAGIPVVVVQHTAPAGAPVFDKGTHAWELHPEVARRARDHYIEKHQASVFTGTDFEGWVRAHGIDTLTIVGYMTHNCDVSTTLQASHLGVKAEFLADATGALPYENSAGRVSAEEIHRAFSVVLHSNFAAVATTAQWTAAVRAGEGLPMDSVPMSNQRARATAAERRA